MRLLPVALVWIDVRIGLFIAAGLVAALLLPFLFTEIRLGKRRLGPLWRRRSGRVTRGPQTPVGVGDNRPGVVGNPAPGQADAQSNPYDAHAQHGAPPVRS
jgi:hypothetical protein